MKLIRIVKESQLEKKDGIKQETSFYLPGIFPAVMIELNDVAVHLIRFVPRENLRLQYIYKIGGAIPEKPEDCSYMGIIGFSPMRIKFNKSHSGQRAYYFFRWLDKRSQPGQWSERMSAVIP